MAEEETTNQSYREAEVEKLKAKMPAGSTFVGWGCDGHKFVGIVYTNADGDTVHLTNEENTSGTQETP